MTKKIRDRNTGLTKGFSHAIVLFEINQPNQLTLPAPAIVDSSSSTAQSDFEEMINVIQKNQVKVTES